MLMNRVRLDRQQGITLIICMIILLVLTVMGLSSIRDTSLEEKMAGNLKNHNTAFQAAESALREGEKVLQTKDESDFTGSNGLYQQMESVQTAMSASWAIPSARIEFTDPTLNQGLASEPLFVIEHLSDAVNMTDDLEASPVLGRPFFRVTTLSVGSTGTAEVILQTVFKN
tara:strand:- start:5411 stop:5923 length:513 start_codon:yes stop_codon:yes gene_type:complete